MTRDTFSETLTELRKCTLLGKKQSNAHFIESRRVGASEQEFIETNK